MFRSHLYFLILAWHLSGDGSARTAMSTSDINQAISSRGRESLPMNPYTTAYSGAAVIIPVMGTLALASQVSEIITCYVIASGIHLLVILTSTGTTAGLPLPILEAVMVYCAARNRSRYNYSIVIASRSF